MITPIVFVGRVFNVRRLSARMLGVKSWAFAKALICYFFSLLMRGLSFKARDTVATETPIARAISFIVIDVSSLAIIDIFVMQNYTKSHSTIHFRLFYINF